MEQFPNEEIAKEKAFNVMIGMKDELSVSARILYIALLAVDRDHIITHEQLAEVTGLSVMTIKNVIKELLEKDMILQTRTQGGCFYVVL